MRLGNIFIGLFACVALCGCINDNVIDCDYSEGNSQVFTDDVAYMIVNISDLSSSTTKGVNDKYVTGSSDEQAVHDANFYFYDAYGNYVTKASGWTGIESTNSGNHNTELTGQKLVLITGLTDKSVPKYVVTILNQPEDFEAPDELWRMEIIILEMSETEKIITKKIDGTDYFTMTSSSYLYQPKEYANGSDPPAHDDVYYCATVVSEDNFTVAPPDFDIENLTDDDVPSPVNIYVERLAVKATLYADGEVINNNNQMPGKVFFDFFYDYVTDEDYGTSYTRDHFYVLFDKWGLNATEKESYLMKYIDEDWTDDELGFTWNEGNSYRSHWCESPNYDDDDLVYPTSSADIDSDTPLNYLSANELSIQFGPDYYGYCTENTNTAGEGGIIQSKNSSAITSIVAKATLYRVTEEDEEVTEEADNCDPDAKLEVLTCVKCDGIIYSFNAYVAYACNYLFTTAGYTFYVETTSGVYTPIDKSYCEVDTTSILDGRVKVALKSDYKSTTFYSDNEGKNALSYDDVNDIMDKNFNDYFGKNASGIIDGQMYYNIPIQHMNENTGNEGAILEANYGAVRNHYYYVGIKTVSGPGWGITHPDEPIVPQDEEGKYYLGAQVIILSWSRYHFAVDL